MRVPRPAPHREDTQYREIQSCRARFTIRESIARFVVAFQARARPTMRNCSPINV